MNDATEPVKTKDRPAHFSGIWAILSTLSLFIIVPAVVWLIFRGVNANFDVPPTKLVWEQREAWPAYERQFTSMERGMMSSARTGETYKKLAFDVSPTEEEALRYCVTIAARYERDMGNPVVREKLDTVLAEHPELFYGWYLLATHWQERGQPDEAQETLVHAFELAPAALKRTVTDSAGNPLPGLNIGSAAIGFDRVREDTLDPTLVLLYPSVQTQRDGAWYLPVYKSIYRLADPSVEPGFTNVEHREAWFTFFGNVGKLPDQVWRE
jgi:hypothetical protein